MASWQTKKTVHHDESEQILVKDTHEALITQEQWDLVQDSQRKKRCAEQMEDQFILWTVSARLWKALVLHGRTRWRRSKRLHVLTYKKGSKVVCSSHYIPECDWFRLSLTTCVAQVNTEDAENVEHENIA